MFPMETFWLCFVPLFVAVDAIGMLPAFLGLTSGLSPSRLRAVILQSVITAALVIYVFLGFGPQLLSFLGITVPDFTIAGGILLLVVSLGDLLSQQKQKEPVDPESLGAVPIGVPMITGPAVLATCILLGAAHGPWITGVAATVNVLLAGITFLFSQPLERLLGRTGTKAISKVANLLLAAIAVMLIRRGVADTILAFHTQTP
jgi:multiple antibiotic resistance protein